MKKAIIILCAFLIVAGIVFFGYSNADKVQEESTTEAVVTTVPFDEVVNALKSCDTLDNVAECFNMKSVSMGPDFDNFHTDYWAYSEAETGEKITYSTCIETMTDIADFITENGDKTAIEKESMTGDTLIFEAYLKRHKGEIQFSDDGYLCISLGDVTKIFEIGTDAYLDFMHDFQGTSCVWTPEHPVTMG